MYARVNLLIKENDFKSSMELLVRKRMTQNLLLDMNETQSTAIIHLDMKAFMLTNSFPPDQRHNEASQEGGGGWKPSRTSKEIDGEVW